MRLAGRYAFVSILIVLALGMTSPHSASRGLQAMDEAARTRPGDARRALEQITDTPTPTATPTPSATPTATSTPSITLTPSVTPTPSTTLTPSVTPTPLPPSLVINEVEYNEPGTDDAEFVEIKNVTSGSLNLANFSLRHIDGQGGGRYGGCN